MPSWTHHSLLAGARTVARVAAALVVAIAALTLAGRALGIAGISRITPHSPAMLPTSAIMLALFGIALFVHARPSRRPPVALLARAAGGAGTLLALAGSINFLRDAPQWRTSLTVSITLVLLGVALELDRRRRIDGRIVNVIALAPLLLGVLSVSGYVSGITAFTGLGGTLRISLAAALALVAAGVSLLLARPQRGSVRLLVSDGPGGLVARRLLPLAIVLPLALDAARLKLAESGWVARHVDDWLYAFAIVLALVVVVALLARSLDLLEVGRRAALDRLSASEAQARSVTDTAHDAIVSADAGGAITLFNPAAEELFGWPADEILGRPVTVLMPERYREGHRAAVARLATGAAPRIGGAPVELHGLTRTGREFDLELSLARVDAGADAGVTAIMRDITARKLLERLAREETARTARVVAAQTAIVAGSGDLVDTLHLVAAEARELVGAEGAVVELPDGDDMVYRAAAGSGEPFLGARVPMAGSLAGGVLATGAGAVCHDTETDARVDREVCRRIGLRSMVCVALRHRDETVGVLKVFAGVPGAFTERDVQTLELLAGLAAATVHRAQVEHRLAALHAAGAAIRGAESLEEGLAGALRGMGEQLGWNVGAVWLDDGALACAETWHDPRRPAAPYLELCSDPEAAGPASLVETVLRTGARAWVEQPEVSPEASPDPRRLRAAAECGLQTLIAVPIASRGETLGVVELGSREARTHEAATLELVSDVAAAIGQFVQRRRAEDQIATQAANLAAVAELNHTLAQNPDPSATRPALVRAILDLARADSVMLFEPDGAEHLALTAEAGGLVGVGTRLHVREDEAIVLDVFRSGRGRFVADYVAEAVHARAIQRRTALRSAHYEPIVRDGGAVAGVLVVASRELRTKDAGGIDALMRLLAGEAGTTLALSDLVATLDARAHTDQLTGLANRRTWDHELPRELARARRTGKPLSLALIDLDRFKAYNDTHGHPAGDRLLRGASAAWAERLRTTDLLARYGGEEFAVLLPGCDPASAARVTEELRAAVPGGETCSIGVVTWDGAELAEALVGRADAALYAAKGAGRDRVVAA